MVESVGKKLQQARLAKNLEIEDVAELTKIRPGRIVDLEADEYSHFPSLTYAKSFLAKYARFLGLDIQEVLDKFQISPEISVENYQYLSAFPAQIPSQARWTQRIQPKGFRVPPAVVAVLVLIVLVGVPVFSYLALNIPRVTGTNFVDDTDRVRPSVIAPANSAGTSSGNSAAPNATATPSPSVYEEIAAAASPLASPSLEVKANPASSGTEAALEVRRALPVGASQSATPVDTPIRASLSPAPEKKLEVRAIRRTYVKVTKDQVGTQPVFEGYAQPDSRPIIVQGKRFWVHATDKGAVEVREDGQVVPGNSGDIVID
ncbi:MAG: helix-turn-helix domain-containing protein [Verrucomicrobia bacterium]|nr:helix-turn-helix domain-containing protein [Verrucomicrobiota bacterium]MBV8377662.1 helix-turn-helix domain-containing protein [Verrucomicrobiota bacterium]